MTITVTEFPSVEDRAAELDCQLPDGIVLLPSNFADMAPGDELQFAGETSTAAKLLCSAGIAAARLKPRNGEEGFIHNRSADIVLPIIFVGSEILKSSPDVASLAINVLQDYVIDRFKGIKTTPTVKAEVVIEDRRKKQTKRISYEGNAEGLRELTRAVKALNRR